ncbi:MAG: RHS repeat protein [Polyangiaceae bacterium]|nr:RHS repeat protein [Polyangiaceae bacterium]
MRYDAEGNVVEVTDGMGYTTQVSYCGLNRRSAIIDALGGVVTYAYDTEEHLVGIVNERGEEYRFDLDPAGRTLREWRFDGAKVVFHHDVAGRCCEKVNGARQRTRFVRDAAGRVIEHIHQGGERSGYEYDLAGRLVRAWNSECEVRIERDPIGRIVRESIGNYAVDNVYDAVGNRLCMRLDSNIQFKFDYSGNGNLKRLTTGEEARYTVPFTRDATGNEIVRNLPGAIRIRWERGSAGRPRKMDVTANDKTVDSVEYEWSNNGKIASMTDPRTGTKRYEYDAREFLTKAIHADGASELRVPDLAGNLYRTEDRSDRHYTVGGVIVRDNDTRYFHDGDGRLVEKVLPSGDKWQYTWDDVGQLRSVLRPDGEKVEFSYDPLGRRISKRHGKRTTTYIWSEEELVGEVGSDGSYTAWALEQNAFEPLAKLEDGAFYGIVSDHLGTPKALFDAAGRAAWRAELDIFGRATIEHADTVCPWRWPGMYHDEEIGLHYNRFRYYDPELGRYISPDPFGCSVVSIYIPMSSIHCSGWIRSAWWPVTRLQEGRAPSRRTSSTTHSTVMRHRYSDARLVVPTTSIASPPSWIVRGKASKHSFGEQAMTIHSHIWRESMETTLLYNFSAKAIILVNWRRFSCQTEASSKESFKS